jgi:hypothetical protein
MMCRYNLHPPSAISVYSTLVDIAYGCDGVHTIWRDGKKDQEVYARYAIPRDNANASLDAAEVLVSTSYTLCSFGSLNGVLLSAGHDDLSSQLIVMPRLTNISSELLRCTGAGSVQSIHVIVSLNFFMS